MMTSPSKQSPRPSRMSKPAFMMVLAEASDVKPSSSAVTLVDKCWLTYHGYARWVTRLSHSLTAALRLVEVSTPDEIVDQSRILCQEYISTKLRRMRLLSHKVELKLMSGKPSDVSMELQLIGHELERMYPSLYQTVSKQINIVFKTEAIACKTFRTVGEQLFRSSITWGKVVALFSLASAFSIDCVQQGHPQYVRAIVDTFSNIVDSHLAKWIARQGGWPDLLRAFRTSPDAQMVWLLSLLGTTAGLLLTLGITLPL